MSGYKQKLLYLIILEHVKRCVSMTLKLDIFASYFHELNH